MPGGLFWFVSGCHRGDNFVLCSNFLEGHTYQKINARHETVSQMRREICEQRQAIHHTARTTPQKQHQIVQILFFFASFPNCSCFLWPRARLLASNGPNNGSTQKKHGNTYFGNYKLHASEIYRLTWVPNRNVLGKLRPFLEGMVNRKNTNCRQIKLNVCFVRCFVKAFGRKGDAQDALHKHNTTGWNSNPDCSINLLGRTADNLSVNITMLLLTTFKYLHTATSHVPSHLKTVSAATLLLL